MENVYERDERGRGRNISGGKFPSYISFLFLSSYVCCYTSAAVSSGIKVYYVITLADTFSWYENWCRACWGPISDFARKQSVVDARRGYHPDSGPLPSSSTIFDPRSDRNSGIAGTPTRSIWTRTRSFEADKYCSGNLRISWWLIINARRVFEEKKKRENEKNVLEIVLRLDDNLGVILFGRGGVKKKDCRSVARLSHFGSILIKRGKLVWFRYDIKYWTKRLFGSRCFQTKHPGVSCNI